jgi:hypothetical protein
MMAACFQDLTQQLGKHRMTASGPPTVTIKVGLGLLLTEPRSPPPRLLENVRSQNSQQNHHPIQPDLHPQLPRIYRKHGHQDLLRLPVDWPQAHLRHERQGHLQGRVFCP